MKQFNSPYGQVELTEERLKHIFEFHPDVKKYQKYFAETLQNPFEIHRSKHDSAVLIFYKHLPRKNYLAIVIKTNQRNFILTAYITNKIKH